MFAANASCAQYLAHACPDLPHTGLDLRQVIVLAVFALAMGLLGIWLTRTQQRP
jgi:hypothetical protein